MFTKDICVSNSPRPIISNFYLTFLQILKIEYGVSDQTSVWRFSRLNLIFIIITKCLCINKTKLYRSESCVINIHNYIFYTTGIIALYYLLTFENY